MYTDIWVVTAEGCKASRKVRRELNKMEPTDVFANEPESFTRNHTESDRLNKVSREKPILYGIEYLDKRNSATGNREACNDG